MIPVGAVLGTDERWRIVDDERRGLADLLDTLTPDEWETRTRCGDWRVRDIAAHLALGPRISYGTAVRELAHAHGSVDRMIHDTAVRAADRPVEEIVADLRSIVGSRRLAPGTTRREPLVDILVHGQDIAQPLGRERVIPVAAACDAADRVWTMPWPLMPWPRLRGHRLVATDAPWERGAGKEIRGPIAALLLLLTGRTEAAVPWLNGAVPVVD